MDPVSAVLISNALARTLFEEIVKKRSVRFAELVSDDDADQDQALEALELLENEELIGERPASLRDWTTYFVTASGLGASRALKRLASH